MANGQRTYVGAVAGVRKGRRGPYFPLGTRVRVSDSPWGPGVFTVADRIGHGSELDFAVPGNCRGARRWGRRAVTVTVVR
jgi:3D (Asp-Asp-Asp) domain-containing protein